MSGDGVISVRLQQSLLGCFRASAEHQGITIHEAAKRLIFVLSSITFDQIMELKEPPAELTNPRISLYVGWRALDALVIATRQSKLTNSAIFRRLLYGLLVTNEIAFVQQNGQWKLQITSQETTKNAQENASTRPEK